MRLKIFEKERRELINLLKDRGISDQRVLDALGKVERHKFVPEAMTIHAYKDVALPIGYEQTISQPYTVAFMTQALKVRPDDKILEIGTGSGYQAAVLDAMSAKVYSIERQFEIYNIAQRLFENLGIRVHCKFGDGTIGWEEFAPYDGIIVTAGSPTVPPSLLKQLKIGGRLVIPVGDKLKQSLYIISKTDENSFEKEEIPNFTFVPLIGRNGWNQK